MQGPSGFLGSLGDEAPQSWGVQGVGKSDLRGPGCFLGFQGFGFRALGFGFRALGLGFRVSGFGLRVSGVGLWVSGLGSMG